MFGTPYDAVAAVNQGQADLALANHWNAHEVEQSSGDRYGRVANHFTRGGDPGGFVNVSGVAILKTSRVPEHGARFARMLLNGQAQQRFADVAYEYPLAPGAKAPADLPPLDEIQAPVVDLGALDSIDQTRALLKKVELIS